MKRMPVFILFAFLAAAFADPADASLSRHVVAYNLQARLVPETKTIRGHANLTWINESEIAAGELHFHLYMNAFKNNRSTFMRESGDDGAGAERDADAWGYINVDKIGIKDGADLAPTMEYIQPDDGNADDQTVMKVTLPAPVKPGESISLGIDFTTKLPRIVSRAGFFGDFFMMGQWFPKIGVFLRGEWNCHQYHSSSEFFADFGAYRVEITVPERYVVGATGTRVAEKRNPDSTRTLTYVQEDVHDFAWTACPDFVEFRERFKPDKGAAVDTEMIFLVHKAHLGCKERYIRSLRQGLTFFSENYGPYPYPTITLVDPAPGALAAGGMEYPTLFTAGTMSFMPKGLLMPELVTIHEFGHGYWYGIVASNEFEEAWLDEGLNTYSEVKAMERYYGKDRSVIGIGPLRLGDLSFQRLYVLALGCFDPILKRSWEYMSGASYASNVYAKASLMILSLERFLGEVTMRRVLRTYYERWKFRHPTSEDFVLVAEEVSGKNLRWFFDQALRNPGRLDYAVHSVSSDPISEAEGFFKGKPVRPGAAKKSPEYLNKVLVVRKGEWVFPQTILVVFENGRKIRESWDGKDRWKRFVYTGPERLAFAQVDPDGVWLLDDNWANNSFCLESRPAGPRKIALKVAAWFQNLLSILSL